MGTTIQHVISPVPRDIWHEIIQRDPDALVTQSPEWTDCLCRCHDYRDASRLYKMSDGRQFVLPMVKRQGLPARLFAIEMSFPNAWGIGGLIGSEPLIPQDVADILADLSSNNHFQIAIRPNPLHGDKWNVALPRNTMRIPRLAHVLDLEGGFEKVWEKRFEHRARWAVRKAERAGLHIERDTTGHLVATFHKMLTQSFEMWAKQQHEPLFLARWRGQMRDPLRKFQSMADILGDACHIWIASLDGEPVAASIILQGTNAHATRSAMNRELANKTQAGVFLEKLAIEEACRAGCRYYHLGESGASGRLDMYKRQFGAIPYEYAEYRIERFPITQVDQKLRNTVKRMIGFRDT
ncbi:MAG: GNAT family N-acetyltransferase [Anaerolineae bacterium]|nr:GNAT family N-acetyltransferase [Anaerolineae bacterium]